MFDGELLQEYEELLYDESVAGRRISESIERILGVPLIRDARAHVSLVLEEAEKATAREASRSEETRSIGTALEQATELRASQRDELERLENQLRSLHAARRAAEAYLESVERYRQLIADREVAREELGTVTPRLGEITVEIRDLMREAWRTVLAEPVRRGRDQARRAAEDALDSVVKGLRRKAVETGSCEVCEQEVSADQRSVLASGLSDDGEGDALTLGVSDGLRRLTELEKFRERHVEEAVIQLEDERRTLSIRKVGLSDRIREVETELADADTDEIESEGQSLREVEQKIRVVETGITGQREEIGKLDQNVDRLSSRLESIGTADLTASQERSKLLRQASEVLVRSIEDYKGELRQRVQDSATKLFLEMTTEKNEYESLEINASYGLNILHTDGRSELGRSAGAEHVIALALMGALQQNAPLRGPVVMDSPFARLDPGHTANVVQALPSIAKQVVLLVQEGEVPRSQIRELLGNQLALEYELEKISARRTNIRAVQSRR